MSQAAPNWNEMPRETIPMHANQKPREHFVPIRKAELLERLCAHEQLSPGDSASLRRVFHLLETEFHVEFHSRLETLKNLYAPFDPDADTLGTAECAEDVRDQQLSDLFDNFSWLLERANFKQLGQQELDQALDACSDWGLNLAVDFSVFDRLQVYGRGDVVGKRSRRRWRNRMKLEEVEVQIYQRLVLIFRLRDNCRFGRYVDTRDVYIKVFKDIPKLDLEMLLPGTQVKMSMVDRTKILLPTISGLSMAIFKIVQGALFAVAMGFAGLLTILGLIGGTIGYGVRSFYGYLNTKQKYQLNLTESLYYQNLDNNAGVLFRLMDEAEEQEVREAMLAYYFLWKAAPAEGWTPDELDTRIEAYLFEATGREIDFEVSDALEKLLRLGVAHTTAQGRVKVLAINPAIEKLQDSCGKLLTTAKDQSSSDAPPHALRRA